MTLPTELRESVQFVNVDHHRRYVPKKCVARFNSHTKGAHRIRLSRSRTFVAEQGPGR